MKKTFLLFLIIIIFCPSTHQINQINNNLEIINKKTQLENNNFYVIATMKFENGNKLINLVQTDDNTFFLEHDEYGNESNIGSVFLDYRNNLADKKMLIYGHNSKILDAPFHFLEKFLNKSYAEENSILKLEVNNMEISYKLFTVLIVKDDLRHVNLNLNSDEYYEHLLRLKNQSLINLNETITQNDSIIIMQTCYYNPENSYLLVGFKKT